jgi:hypothetical protein
VVDQADVERELLIRRTVEPNLPAAVIPWPERRPRYLVTVRLREVGARLECVGLAVDSISEATSVQSSTMRSLPVGAIVDEAKRRVLTQELELENRSLTEPRDGEPALIERGEHFQQRAELIEAHLARATGHGTGKRYPPGHLEMVAEVYRDAKGRRPTKAVADAFRISPTAAANQVVRARQLGFLETGGSSK